MNIMKRFMALGATAAVAVVASVLFGVFFTVPAHAATPYDDCFAFSGGTITDYYDNRANNPVNPACPRDVDIPATIGGVPVTAIGTNAFYAPSSPSSKLTHLTIPEGVITISNNAFRCNALPSIVIPNSVTTISSRAFSNNTGTGPEYGYSLSLGSGLTNIGASAFEGGAGSFGGCSHHGYISSSIVIPNSVLYINPRAFTPNKAPSITLGNSLRQIASEAFVDSMDLTDGNLVIPASVESVGNQAFAYSNLTSLSFAGTSSLTAIGANAFTENLLSEITIPSSVTSIGDGAFERNSLTDVTIHGNPTLGANTFTMNGIDVATTIGIPWNQFPVHYQNNAQLVRVYATNPTFAAAHPHGVYTRASGGTTYVAGAFITNPASMTLRYLASGGSALASSLTLTGMNGANPLANWAITNTLDTSVPNSPTVDFAPYFRIGSSFTPGTALLPTIGGYNTPPTRTFVLGSASMAAPFYYLTPAQAAQGYTLNAQGQVVAPNGMVVSSVPGAPNTGVARQHVELVRLLTATVVAVGGLSVLGWLAMRRYNRS